MTEYTVSQWALFFYLYCFAGWVWESVYVSICKRRLVNRGFLKGPFLPIYGSGAMCILLVTVPVRGNIPAMCLVGMAAAAVLEYVTGYVMERLFKVRYWDYTGKFMNVHGYICLASVLCWGVMTLLVVDVIHVRVERLVLSIDVRITDVLVMILTVLFTADFVTSFNAAMKLRAMLDQKERVTEELKKLAEKKRELELAVRDSAEEKKEQIRRELDELHQSALVKMNRLHAVYFDSMKSVRGLLRRNPNAISVRYKDSFAELKRSMSEKLEEMMREADEKLDALMSGAGERIGEIRMKASEKLSEMRSEASGKRTNTADGTEPEKEAIHGGND